MKKISTLAIALLVMGSAIFAQDATTKRPAQKTTEAKQGTNNSNKKPGSGDGKTSVIKDKKGKKKDKKEGE